MWETLAALHGMNVSSTIIFVGLCIRCAMYNTHFDLPALVEKILQANERQKASNVFHNYCIYSFNCREPVFNGLV